jgi:hypothetical protein
MTGIKKFAIALLAVAALTAASAPTAKADGWYVGGTYSTGNAYWDPACGCWVYPSYSYYPTYTYAPNYTYYGYPRYYYPYYSRPSLSVGFSFGTGSHSYGGYDYRRRYR